jgi:hypothetical protein
MRTLTSLSLLLLASQAQADLLFSQPVIASPLPNQPLNFRLHLDTRPSLSSALAASIP